MTTLPYENQIRQLLEELAHYQIVVEHGQKEKARYTEELRATCGEIETAVLSLEEKQKIAIEQWKEMSDYDRGDILLPVITAVEQMCSLMNRKGCGTMGDYLENYIMDAVLDLLEVRRKAA